MRNLLIATVALLASSVTCADGLPFTHSTDSRGGAVVTSVDDAANQGNIEVGDRIIRATRILGNISKVRSSAQLSAFALEATPAGMIFLHVVRADGKIEIRIAPLR